MDWIDYMDNLINNSAEPSSPLDMANIFFNGFCYIIGFGLLITGAVLQIIILQEIYQVYQNIDSNTFINTLIN